MPNPAYQKGKRLEVKTKAWFSTLDPGCLRSFMSRGADVTFQWLLRLWTISCKSGRPKSISLGKIKGELETYDICVTNEDHDPFPVVHIYMPKFIEILGRAEAHDQEDFAA